LCSPGGREIVGAPVEPGDVFRIPDPHKQAEKQERGLWPEVAERGYGWKRTLFQSAGAS
jgi:hypothetical protein